MTAQDDYAACIHHWIIESPDGVESPGTCQKCGAERTFANYIPQVAWSNTFGRPKQKQRNGANDPLGETT